MLKNAILPTRTGLASKAVLWLMLCCWGCSGTKTDDSIKPQTDEFVSGSINGREFTDPSPVADYDDYSTSAVYFNTVSVFEISSSEGYLVNVSVKNPKVGTFSSKTGAVTGDVTYVAGTLVTPIIQAYTLTTTNESTVVITKLDTQGYVEGTFSLLGKATNGKTLTLVNGKFRCKD